MSTETPRDIWFLRGFAEAVTYVPSWAIESQDSTGVILCTTIPDAVSEESVEAFKDGARLVAGPGIQFLIERR